MTDVLLVRALGGDDRDAPAMHDVGLTVIEDPYLTVATCADARAADRARAVLVGVEQRADWMVVTSKAALRALVDLRGEAAVERSISIGQKRGVRFATVGSSTAAALESIGAEDVLVPRAPTAAALLSELVSLAPARVIAPQGSQAMTSWTRGLREHGWEVDEQVLYVTSTIAERPRTADLLASGGFAAVLFRSPTAVRAVMSFVDGIAPPTLVVCGGPTTAAEARRLGLERVLVSPGSTAPVVAETVVAALSSTRPEVE